MISHPSVDRELWSEYLAGAYRCFSRHGVQSVLDVGALRGGADTAMFFAVIDDRGDVVGGLRARGPLRSSDESQAVLEWAGQPGQQAIRDMITDRIPFGILEMKSGWVIDDPDRKPVIASTVARSGFQIMVLLDTQFCMATAATSVLRQWRSSGGVVAAIPATPYPDDRYRTKIIWWNRHDFFNHAEPAQVSQTLADELLLHQWHRRRRATAVLPEWITIAHAKPAPANYQVA